MEAGNQERTKVAERIRSLGINLSCRGMNWAIDTFVAVDGPLTLSDRFGWWLEDVFSRLFQFCYDGSQEELDAIRDTPRIYQTKRQRIEGRKLAISGVLFDEVCCTDCDAPLLVNDEVSLCASCRALHPEMLLEVCRQ